MIQVMIQQAAKRRGIRKAYQFGKSVGLSSRVATRVWQSDQLPKLKTLDRICVAWGCGLDELIVYVPDKVSRNGHTSSAPQKQTAAGRANKKVTKVGKLPRPRRSQSRSAQ